MKNIIATYLAVGEISIVLLENLKTSVIIFLLY